MSVAAYIRAQLRGEGRMTRLDAKARRMSSFGPEWIGIKEASRILCCASQSIVHERSNGRYPGIESRPASPHAQSGRGCGLLVKRSDCERIAQIRRRCKISLTVACRIYAAIKAGGPL